MEGLAGTLRVIAEPTRLRLLQTLLEDDATVSELAALLDLPQPRVSAHLAPLREAGLVAVKADGRQRAYHADEGRIAPLLDALRALSPAGKNTTTTADDDSEPMVDQQSGTGQAPAPLRHARTCYGHLAGVAGVALLDEMLRRGWIEPVNGSEARKEYRLTAAGDLALRDRGVNVAAAERSRRLFAFGCPDWTERRPHLGGALGVALLDALVGAGAARREVGRTVTIHYGFHSWFAQAVVTKA